VDLGLKLFSLLVDKYNLAVGSIIKTVHIIVC